MIIFRALHRLYKNLISPFLGNNCRFHPSCSDYALEALEKHGIFRGGLLSIKRILKCQPFSSAGWSDPVPVLTVPDLTVPYQKRPCKKIKLQEVA